ncbi:MAG TPA: HD domain-containing protein [Candidatus Woesebacteria bacterium]|nr:HD domain-containing protein [Candidatus Woesebacteria bacterium]
MKTELSIVRFYRKDECLNSSVPAPIIHWFETVTKDNWLKTNNKERRAKIEYKINHTYKTVEAGWEIMAKESSVDWDKSLGTIICLLHDIGRFPQARQSNTFIDAQSGIDHATLGAEMFLKQNFDIPHKEEIVEAIFWHSRKEYPGRSNYVRLVKDADKTALFRDFDFMEKNDVPAFHLSGNQLSPKRLASFLNGEFLPDRSFNSLADWYLFNAGWFWDLNFATTKQIWRQEKFAPMLLAKLKSIGVDPDQLQLIESKLTSFL